jgi:NAD(P)-dependent dehydrogenase (short-subunit alcohol dehydrogenase family)
MNKKVAIVTGSSSGIGAATGRLFACNGFNVVINYSRNPAPAEAVADECRQLGADMLVVKANVAQDEDCRAMAAAMQSEDVADACYWLCAGSRSSPFIFRTAERKASVFLARYCANGGSILSCSSGNRCSAKPTHISPGNTKQPR